MKLYDRDERLAPWPRTESEVRKHLHDYYAVITAMDAHLGRLLGGVVPSGLDGKSFAPVMMGESVKTRDSIFLAYKDSQRAVRQGDYKLIRFPLIDKTQLFNLGLDPPA